LLNFRLIVALAVAFHLQLGGMASAENKKVTVSQALQTLHFLPLYVAIDEGLFAKHGLDVTKETANGPNAAIADLTSGKAQFSLTAAAWSATAVSKGAPIHLIANCVNGAAAWVVGPADFDFKDIASLKGQTIIAGKMPTSTTAVFLKSVHDSGMDPKKDITLMEVKLGSETAALLTLGDKAKIAVAGEPAADWAVTLGMKVLVSFPKSQGNFLSSGVAARKDLDPDTAQRFVSAMQEALTLIERDPAAAVAVGKKEFPKLAPEVVESAVRRMLADNLYAKSVDIAPEGLKKGLELYLDAGAPIPAYEQMVNRAYVEKALAAR
jgi:NitT/TauT family transport system substrate-binding protein